MLKDPATFGEYQLDHFDRRYRLAAARGRRAARCGTGPDFCTATGPARFRAPAELVSRSADHQGRRRVARPARFADRARVDGKRRRLHRARQPGIGGSASSARTSATSSCARGHRVICVDNLDTGSLREHRAPPRRRDFRLHQPRRDRAVSSSTSRSTSSSTSPRPATPDRLPAAAAAHARRSARYGTHNALGLAKSRARGSCSRRRARSTATRRCTRSPRPTGATSTRSARAASTTRPSAYAEALTMAYHRQQGVDTAIVRIFNTYGPRMRPARRPRDPDVHPPGAREQAADGVRRRLADAQLLLRRRPRSAGFIRARRVRRAPAR